MPPKESTVTVIIEALDEAGNIVPLRRSEEGNIEPGDEKRIVIQQGTAILDLVQPQTHEVVVVALHDVRDHAFVSYDASVVEVRDHYPLPRENKDPIQVRPLTVGQSVELWRRPDKPATFPQIAAYRLTRTN